MSLRGGPPTVGHVRMVRSATSRNHRSSAMAEGAPNGKAAECPGTVKVGEDVSVASSQRGAIQRTQNIL